MKQLFTITRPGRYTVPNWGRLDTTIEVPNERLLALYQYKGFPWIVLNPGKETVTFLKKQKLNDQQLAALIQRASTPEEIETLLKVKSSDTLKKIAETRINALKKE